ncbi:sensor histidine kinase [Enorma phocaeensis]|uniref:sensor histidine kinase n=1 Tax=Enorma phocaeensis TaxID=1871019 RepID=UPI0032091E25
MMRMRSSAGAVSAQAANAPAATGAQGGHAVGSRSGNAGAPHISLWRVLRAEARKFRHAETNGPDSTPDTFVIMVDDDGPGFSPAALEHGCERFFRDDASRTGAASGAHYGIGLFTAAETARDHGGSLELSNRLDADGSPAGARVVVRLPLA